MGCGLAFSLADDVNIRFLTVIKIENVNLFLFNAVARIKWNK